MQLQIWSGDKYKNPSLWNRRRENIRESMQSIYTTNRNEMASELFILIIYRYVISNRDAIRVQFFYETIKREREREKERNNLHEWFIAKLQADSADSVNN